MEEFKIPVEDSLNSLEGIEKIPPVVMQGLRDIVERFPSLGGDDPSTYGALKDWKYLLPEIDGVKLTLRLGHGRNGLRFTVSSWNKEGEPAFLDGVKVLDANGQDMGDFSAGGVRANAVDLLDGFFIEKNGKRTSVIFESTSGK